MTSNLASRTIIKKIYCIVFLALLVMVGLFLTTRNVCILEDHLSPDLKFVQVLFDEALVMLEKYKSFMRKNCTLRISWINMPPEKLDTNSLSDNKATFSVISTNTTHHFKQQEFNNSLFKLHMLHLIENGKHPPLANIHFSYICFYFTILKCLSNSAAYILNYYHVISYLGTICISLLLTMIMLSSRKIFFAKKPVAKYRKNGIIIKSLYFNNFGSLLSNLLVTFLHDWHISELLNLNEKCTVKNKTTYKHIFTCPSQTFTQLEWLTYPVHDLSRLASFRPLSNLDSPVAFISLATAGFSYNGQGYIIICSGCQRSHDLRQVTTDPASSIYHLQGCIYIQPDEQLYREEVETDSSSAVSDASTTSVITSTSQENLELSSPDLPLVRAITAHTLIEPITLPSVLPTVPPSRDTVPPQTSQQTACLLGHPSYPIFVTLQKRLETFVNWPIPHIQNSKALAEAGFFFAGYGDCVRCFHCGLGLKSWKPTDNVYVEHEKLRPSCLFLQAQLTGGRSGSSGDPHSASLSHQALLGSQTSASHQASSSIQTSSPSVRAVGGGIVASGQQTSNSLETDSLPLVSHGAMGGDSVISGDKTVTKLLLERENRLLHQLMTCKICKEQPIKDLFLPCGDLYACSQCSQRMTRCPLCGKKILGTVTVYFA